MPIVKKIKTPISKASSGPLPDDTRIGRAVPDSDEFWEFRNVLKPKPVTRPGKVPDEWNVGPRIADKWTEFYDNLSAKPSPRPTRTLAQDSAGYQDVLDNALIQGKLPPNGPKRLRPQLPPKKGKGRTRAY